MSSLGLYLLQDGTHADPGGCAPDDKGVLRHTESGLAVCLYEDGTPQTVGQDAINNMNLAAAKAAEPDAPDVPVVTSLLPDHCAIGDPDFTLFIVGRGFAESSVIVFAGHDEPTTLNEDGTRSTGVKPSLWGAPVVVQCSVRNGTLHGNAVDFTFAAATGMKREPDKKEEPKKPAAKEVKPEEPKPGYVTRETKPAPGPERGGR